MALSFRSSFVRSAFSLRQSGQLCAFSTTARRFATQEAYLPTFEQTSSPELDELLSKIRNRILLQKHLNVEQQRLVRDPKQRSQLETEEVLIQIGDTDARLLPFDQVKDSLNVRKSLLQALAATKNSEDWNIWPDLLRGAQSADVRIKKNIIESFVRRALNAGETKMVLGIVTQDWTPISLEIPVVRTGIMLAIRKIAEDSEWDSSTLKQALGYAETVNRLARKKEHGALIDGFADPLMTAVPLELCARISEVDSNVTEAAEPDATKASDIVRAPPRNFENEAATYASRLTSMLEHTAELNDSEWQYKVQQDLRPRAAKLALEDMKINLMNKIRSWQHFGNTLTQVAEVSPKLMTKEFSERTRGKIEELISTGYESLSDCSKGEYSHIKFDLDVSRDAFIARINRPFTT